MNQSPLFEHDKTSADTTGRHSGFSLLSPSPAHPQQQPTELKESTGSQLVLPSLEDPKHRLSSRQCRLLASANATDLASAEAERKRRTQLTQKVAANLMKSALNQQPDLFPAFVGDREDQGPAMLRGSDVVSKPTKKLLMVPCLGLAAGVNAMGGCSVKYATSSTESKRIIERERAANETLFSMWESRNAIREEFAEIATMEENLRTPLWNNFRRALTEEEAIMMREVERMQSDVAEERKKYETSHATQAPLSVGGVRCPKYAPWGYTVSGRGVAFPLRLYERLFNRVITGMHRHLLILLKGKVSEDVYGISMSLSSSPSTSRSLGAMLRSQIKLSAACASPRRVQRDEEVEDASESHPPAASIPNDLCFGPVLTAETSLSVALLWRILDQAKSLSPGISWALQLYTKYILPHVYENFALREEHLPWSGALGEQVDQLSALPLNLLRYRNMETSATQAKGDVRYMEEAMKRWAWRTWRQSMLEKRRRELGAAVLDKIFKRLHNAKQLQKCFSQWRIVTKEGCFTTGLEDVNQKYNTFVVEAKHAARDMQLFPCLEEKAVGPSPAVVDQSKFVALKLAETATHTRPKAKADSGGKSEGVESEAEKGEGDKAVDGEQAGWKQSLENMQTPTRVWEQTATPSGFLSISINNSATPMKWLEGSCSAGTAARNQVSAIFDTMLRKLYDMEKISGHLREGIAVQNRIIQKLERENESLKEKVYSLEESLRESEEMRLHYCNIVQERELDIRELERRNTQLKSRLRCQEQRPWQRTVLRVIGDICGASTALSELVDDSRGSRQKQASRKVCTSPVPALPSSGNSVVTNASSKTTSCGDRVGSAGQRQRGQSPTGEVEEDDYRKGMSRLSSGPPGAEAERLYGKLAPIVLSSTRFMPDSQTILRDWANNCLDDLESLDDLKGGALSTRFYSFSQEARSGVLLSRLLFYLALPRYQNKTATDANNLGQHGGNEGRNFPEQRRRLLMHERVQLETPFPTYSDCFGDLLSMKSVNRMSALLHFARELLASGGQPGDAMVQKRMDHIYDLTLKAVGMTPPPPVDRVDLHEIIDPHALARGDTSATITLVALLYVRFSHPFNHKAKQSAVIERDAMMYLLSKGTYTQSTDSTKSDSPVPLSDSQADDQLPLEDEGKHLARKFLAQLEEDERSPWQLFLKHCQPLINTMAHPYILRGNFWPSTAFDSPDLAYMLGTLGLALQRSLQEHRWHIILSCLVPVRTYSGMSRGIYTGGRSSVAALQAGLYRVGDWVFPDELPCIRAMFRDREAAIRAAVGTGVLKCVGEWTEDEWNTEGFFTTKNKGSLLKSFETCGSDLMQLFLQRAKLSHTCAMPAIDLGSWRLLLMDVGLVSPDDPETSLLDLEQVTNIFCMVMSSLVDVDTRLEEPNPADAGYSTMPLSYFSDEMFFPEFVAALVLLIHEMYPSVYRGGGGEGENESEPTITWLGDALRDFHFRQVVPHQVGETMIRPSSIMKAIRANARAHEVLVRHNKVLQVLHTTYSRDICGLVGIEKDQVVQMLRDAALTSSEISQSVITDLFKACCVSKKVDEALLEERRRENDSRPRDVPVVRRRGNVSILDPTLEGASATKVKEFFLLLYDGFLEFLCVLCHFNQPNPLIPFEQRLEKFLMKGVFRPLAHRSEGLAMVMSQHLPQSKHDGSDT
ncbi:uncharacterized protein TEOVI_000236700 [Trypanosoma equiperdum]|uniref:Uncharacterized protein n=1 Tax=Trypanosoma equiperdum TaxID=5694 RepID=A0A1G4IEJ3_TRYEQ|nr:hypothetical protein, conserved [Trypanosoma equiperdum]